MNDTFVDLLSQLKEIHAGEPFRASAYGRAKEAVAQATQTMNAYWGLNPGQDQPLKAVKKGGA